MRRCRHRGCSCCSRQNSCCHGRCSSCSWRCITWHRDGHPGWPGFELRRIGGQPAGGGGAGSRASTLLRSTRRCTGPRCCALPSPARHCSTGGSPAPAQDCPDGLGGLSSRCRWLLAACRCCWLLGGLCHGLWGPWLRLDDRGLLHWRLGNGLVRRGRRWWHRLHDLLLRWLQLQCLLLLLHLWQGCWLLNLVCWLLFGSCHLQAGSTITRIGGEQGAPLRI